MQNEEWNVSAVSLSPELVRLAQQKQLFGRVAAVRETAAQPFFRRSADAPDVGAVFGRLRAELAEMQVCICIRVLRGGYEFR